MTAAQKSSLAKNAKAQQTVQKGLTTYGKPTQAQKKTGTARRAQPLTQSQAKALGASAKNQQAKANPMTAEQAQKLARVKALKAKQAKAAPKRQPGSNASKLARVRALKARQAAMRNRRGRR